MWKGSVEKLSGSFWFRIHHCLRLLFIFIIIVTVMIITNILIILISSIIWWSSLVMLIKTRPMLNDVACDRVIFLVARRHWSLSSHKRQWSPPTKAPINEGGRKLTEGTSMGGKKAAFDKVFYSKEDMMEQMKVMLREVGNRLPCYVFCICMLT